MHEFVLTPLNVYLYTEPLKSLIFGSKIKKSILTTHPQGGGGGGLSATEVITTAARI